ncbi:hypothetical protein A176_006577 [Myxococcus hansupus]|uniref:DUF4419 domain-containing protein n=1 Tax=Pseudomyxococcus hansupus TaxID=1297742 RepID=A0A0H4X7W2_9BACT|nr:DUF4419 domain-containing protein [Myxococcus hansupus]AKQ69665.1 hypothetical protein A176_006577 [Myxococcus hansupus]
MVTFEVDSVEEASAPPVMTLLGTLIQDVRWMAPGRDTRVLEMKGIHPLLAAVHAAFAEHRPLVLSPDAVWLTIAQGVAQHVRLNAEALRSRIVRHEGRKTLTVDVGGLPETDSDYLLLFSSFRHQLREALGQGMPRLLSCDFSTSTDVERMAGDVVLMDAMSPYFDFVMACVCGIPRVTLLGTPEDWKAIRRRIDVIQELDLSWWTSSLIPIMDAFVSASEGRPDREYWKEMYKPAKAYGWDRATGWIARLIPYVAGHGSFSSRNPMLKTSHAELMASCAKAASDRWYEGPGLALQDAPAGLSSVPLKVTLPGRGESEAWTLEAGVLAVEVDDAGALIPRVGVTVKDGGTSAQSLIERIFAEHTATRATRVDAFQGTAELNALFAHIEEATLFSGENAWRIRPCTDHAEIRIAVDAEGSERITVVALMDLPDGTVLAWRDAYRKSNACVVRLNASQLEPRPPVGEDEIQGWSFMQGARLRVPVLTSAQTPAEIPVVGTSFLELLTRVLDSGGSTHLEPLATLDQRLMM